MRVVEQTNAAAQVNRGLEGVVAAATQIAEVDGANGHLTLRGYDIQALIGRVTFEEVAYLLWHGRLPKRPEYEELCEEMRDARQLPEPILAALRELAPHATGMHLLRMAASMLSVDDPLVDSLDIEVSRRRAARLQAQLPALVAHTWRLSNGQELVPPREEHGLAEGFLYMLEGTEPSQPRIEAFDAYLGVIAEHGLNASTFTSRVVISTNSDMVSALTAAIGALKGPAHGGVPGPVLHMLEEIGLPENAEPWIRAELGAGRRIMGFGHRVYKVRDPRAAVLTQVVERMAVATDERTLLELTKAVEQTTVKVLAEMKPGRDLYANVELYAGLILHTVGIPPEIFTSMFAIGRTAGWTAHMIEQLDGNRLMRPLASYMGPRDLKWCPLDERE